MDQRMFKMVFGRSKWNVLLFMVALSALIGSFSALAYTTLNQRTTETLTVNGRDYEWETLNEDFELETVEDIEGVPLDELIRDAGVHDPEEREYAIMAADGYMKTVEWSDMKKGIISAEGNSNHEKMVVFEDKAKAYWVFDVVEIEVV